MQSATSQENTGRFKTDKNYKRYINPLSGYKYNAISVGISELLVMKSFDIHYQRRITPRIWAEGGLMFGIGSMTPEYAGGIMTYLGMARESTNWTFETLDPAFRGDYFPENGIKTKNGYRLGLYRSIIGIAPFNTISYGLQYVSRKLDVQHLVSNSTSSNEIMNTSLCKSNSFLASLMYKSNLAGPIGLDVCIGAGPTFINISGGNPVAIKKINYVAFDYSLQVRLFFSFLKF